MPVITLIPANQGDTGHYFLVCYIHENYYYFTGDSTRRQKTKFLFVKTYIFCPRNAFSSLVQTVRRSSSTVPLITGSSIQSFCATRAKWRCCFDPLLRAFCSHGMKPVALNDCPTFTFLPVTGFFSSLRQAGYVGHGLLQQYRNSKQKHPEIQETRHSPVTLLRHQDCYHRLVSKIGL